MQIFLYASLASLVKSLFIFCTRTEECENLRIFTLALASKGRNDRRLHGSSLRSFSVSGHKSETFTRPDGPLMLCYVAHLFTKDLASTKAPLGCSLDPVNFVWKKKPESPHGKEIRCGCGMAHFLAWQVESINQERFRLWRNVSSLPPHLIPV